jgi:hypothetical protein
MHDYDSGLDLKSFRVVADFAIDGYQPGTNLASQFKVKTQGVWEWVVAQPMKTGTLIVSVKDRAGNETRLERTFKNR